MSQLKDLVVTGKARFIGQVYANNLVGKISEADVAYKDTLNQNISTTYIKDASVSGKTVTFTKGNGSTFSFDTYDTTYTQASSDTLGLVKIGQNLSIDNNGVLSAYNLQYDTMPTADESMAGKVIQYTGETTANYTKGYFYKCEVGEIPATYQAPNGQLYKYHYHWTYANGHGWNCWSDEKMVALNENYSSVAYENQLVFYAKSGVQNFNVQGLAVSNSSRTPYTEFININNENVRIYVDDLSGYHTNSNCYAIQDNGSGNITQWMSAEDAKTYLSTPGYVWIQVDSQPEYTLPNASTATLGGIKVGQNLSIDENGVLSASDSYVLPAATASTLGGIKVGENLTIDNTGVLSAEAATKIVPATNISVSPIADGSNSDVLTFEFNCKKAVDMIEFFANVNLLVSTTVSNENYSDCVLTITYSLDDVVKATLNQTYRDGYNIVSLNYIITELTQGNHVFKVNFAPVGGSIS